MDNTAVVASSLTPAGSSASAFARMSPRVKGMLALGAAGLVAVVSAAWLWARSPDYRVLFTNLSDRDGGSIIASLAQMNIPYKSGDGGVLLVPSDKVHEARLKLASQGLPKGSLVGFEIMETQKFGVTQFQEQVNYQRGLEGELARSIQALAPVAQARVHLALPKASGFLREKQPPTASVLLQLHPGRTLDRTQVAGIVHLVSSSVPELSTKNVSVVDQSGNLLASDRTTAAGLDAAQLDYVGQIEANTIKRIEDILEPILGRGNVRAQVTADIDFTQIEATSESYTPNQGADAKAAVRSSTTSESAQPGPTTPQGIPGALSNQPPVPATAPIAGAAPPLNAAPAAAANNGSTRRDATTNYEVDKSIRHTRQATGQIRRLTAAVVVNHRSTAAAAGGAAQSAPLSEQEIQNITALARDAMGFSQQRGDSLNVVNAAFSQPELAPVQPVPVWKQPDTVAMVKEVGKALLFLLLTSIVVFGVLRPALKSMGAAPKAPPLPLPAGPAPEALAASADSTARQSSVEHVRQLAKNDPATVANVVKNWVAADAGKAA